MTKPKDKLAATMRVLKNATCKAISGKSTLTYQIGCQPDSNIYLNISANTGGGFFSQEWIALKDIQQALKKETPITAMVLYPLFRGKSVNTPAFLLAALVNEKLLRPLKGKKRNHERLDPKDFMTKIDKLMSSTVNVNPKKTVKNPTKKSSKKIRVKKRDPAKRKKA